MIAETREGTLDTTNWQKVVAIVQEGLCDGTLAEESTWQAVVLIPKGKSDNFRGNGLVEVLWKTMKSLLNLHLTETITFHDVMHRFWAGCGTGTTALEAKLLQQLTDMGKALLQCLPGPLEGIQ